MTEQPADLSARQKAALKAIKEHLKYATANYLQQNVVASAEMILELYAQEVETPRDVESMTIGELRELVKP